MDPRPIRFQNPMPVAGVPAYPVPPNALGNGASAESLVAPYGEQIQVQWLAGDRSTKSLLSLQMPPFGMVWRVSLFGAVTFKVTYGTRATRTLAGFQAPSVFTSPGKVQIDATPTTGEGALANVAVSQASGGARALLRRFITAPAGDVNIQPEAVNFLALVASSLTTSGQIVAVPALSECPLVAGSVLHSGAGFQEFEL